MELVSSPFLRHRRMWRRALARVGAALLLTLSLLVAIPGTALAAGLEYPDLVSAPPRNATDPVEITFGTDTFLGVQFDGLLSNVGAGPLDLYGNPSAASMKQRVKDGNDWVEVATPEVLFETSDGHNHWHLMKIARYSLWNDAKTAEVAPGQKIGFCLYDIEPIAGVPSGPAFYEGSVVQWCQAGDPNATELRMGISSGWNDVYRAGIALQWVDVSNVAPGRYWLAAEIDPFDVVVEADETNNGVAFATTQTVVPGHLAQPVGPVTVDGPFATVTLAATTFGDPGSRAFRITSPPSHGTLDVPTGVDFTSVSVVYTPDEGYTGTDSFSYVALDQDSPYPLSPPAAGVAIDVVGIPDASVTISGAPAQLEADTSVQLSAMVVNADPTVTWSVNGVVGGSGIVGTIDPTGLYTAPSQVPAGGSVTIRATSTQYSWAFDEVTITILPGPRPPILTNPGPQQHTVGEKATLRLEATDPDGDSISYGATNLPPGLTINSLTGVITGTVTTAGSWTVTGTATDGGFVTAETFEWTVVAAPPIIGTIGDVTVDEGDTVTVPISIIDPNGLGYICTLFGPGYVTKDAANTELTIAPGFDDAGTDLVTVSATNDAGATATEEFTVTVVDVNRPPTVGPLAGATVPEGTATRIDAQAADPDGDPLAITAAGATFVTVDPITQEIVIDPGYFDAGTYPILVTATDPGGEAATTTFTVEVPDVNRPPVLSVASTAGVAEASTLEIPVAASDPDGDPVGVVLSSGPAFVTLNLSGTMLTVTPGYADAGTYGVTIGASDGRGGGTSATVTITVADVNRAPTIGPLSPAVVAEGDSLNLSLSGSDPDGDPVSFGVVGAGFASVVGSTLRLAPGYEDAGTHAITVTVDDGSLTSDTSLVVTVPNTNRLPDLTTPAVADVAEGATLVVPVTVSDPDGEAVTLAVSGAAFVSVVGSELHFAPGYQDAGTHIIDLVATDVLGGAVSTSFPVTITDVNRAPTLVAAAAVAVAEDEIALVGLDATDPDGDPVTVAVSGAPFASIVGTDLRLAPSFEDAGTHTLTVEATDGRGGLTSTTVVVDVGNVNRAPSLDAVGSLALQETDDLLVPLYASDPDGDPLTVTVAGAAFASREAGALRLTPGWDDAGDYVLRVTVADPSGLEASIDVPISVANLNRLPAVTAVADLDAAVGERVAVQIDASDPDGESLVFDAIGLPAGLALGPTGLIEGAAGPRQAGTYPVTVRVTDGFDEVAMSFTLTVSPLVDAAPIASIGYRLPRSTAPALVRFEARRSTDPDGGRLLYDWDLDGDGAFDDAQQMHVARLFLGEGTYTVALRVTDLSGNHGVASVTFTLEAGGGGRAAQVAASAPLGSITSTAEGTAPSLTTTAPERRRVGGFLYLL